LPELCPSGRQGLLDESIRLVSGEVRVALVASGYRYAKKHRTLADLGEFVNGRSEPLAGKECTEAGGFRADPTEVTAEAGVKCAGLWVYQAAKKDSDARLVAWLDDADGLPAEVESGQVVKVAWAGDIFAI
jgi:hypothetical protein